MSLDYKKMATDVLKHFEDIPDCDVKIKHENKLKTIQNLSDEKSKEFNAKYSNDLISCLKFVSKKEFERLSNKK